MTVDDRSIKVLLENKKYRIFRIDASPGKVHQFDLCRGTQRLQLQVGGTLATLEQRYWFFGWHWMTLEVTNMYSIAEKWIEMYFKKEKQNEVS